MNRMKRVAYFFALSFCLVFQETIAQGTSFFSFEQSSYEVWEDDGTIEVVIVRDGGEIFSATVDISAVGVTLIGSNRVVFLSGDTTETVSVSNVDNQTPNEDVVGTLILQNPQVPGVGAEVSDPSSATITIKDNDPVWSSWGQFGDCSVGCGDGTRTRTRECIDPRPDGPDGDDVTCDGNSTETADCTSQESCPAWSSWGQWSDCTVSCGTGTRTRTRTCDDPDTQDDVTSCQGDPQDTEDCNTETCPATGTASWSQWDSWNLCTVTCGGGTQTRSRTCNDTDSGDGITCSQGSGQESRNCNEQSCQAESNTVFWTQDFVETTENVGRFFLEVERTTFDSELTLDVTSSGDILLVEDDGDFTTQRQITFPANVNELTVGIDVIDDNVPESNSLASLTLSNPSLSEVTITLSTINIRINDDDDAVVPPAWTPWAAWGDCSVTCGVGNRIRSRSCASIEDCIGAATENQMCDSQETCPIWGDWGQWSECTQSCGSGLRIRSRSCNALGTGASCAGSNTDSEQCNRRCPGVCESDVEITPYGRLRAPGDQPVGSVYVSSAVCPWYTRDEGSPVGTATCVERNGQLVWDWDIGCGGDKTTQQQCSSILTRPITPENAREVLDDTCSVLNDGGNDIDEQCVSNVINVLEDVVNLQLPEREITDGVINVVDKLCLADPDALSGPRTSLGLKFIEKQLKIVDIEREDVGYWPYRRVTDNIATEAYWASNEELCRGLYVASTRTGSNSNQLLLRERQSIPNIDAEIEIPPDSDICDRFPNGARVVLDVMASDKLLPSTKIRSTNTGQNRFNRVINSPVISVTIGDQEIGDLDDPVRLLFTPLEIHSNNTQCVYWDWPRNDWSSQGCRYLGETPNWQRICECDHLTSFAVQMDIYNEPSSGVSTGGQVVIIVVSVIAACLVVFLLLGGLCVWLLRGAGVVRRRREEQYLYHRRRRGPYDKERVAPRSYPRF